MENQLWSYRVKPQDIGKFVFVWHEDLRPRRERHGFEVAGKWIDKGHELVCLVSHAGPEGYATAEEASYESSDRHAVSRDPDALVETTELRLLRPVRS